MRCGIVAVDRAGRLVLMNQVALQVLDLASRPDPGTPLAEALPEHPQLVRLLHDSFGLSSLPNRAELELHAGTRDRRTIGFTVSLVPGACGEPIGAAVFFKDLTQIEHREEQERLRDRLAGLGEMAASLAHEIRNPLASIDVTCSLLRRHLQAIAGSEPRWQELLGKVTVEVRRLSHTVDSSLEFVRPPSLDLAVADLDAAIDEAIAVAERRAGRPGIRVVRRRICALPPFLMDRDKLRQVFENLVLNAMEAIGERGVVTVETELRHVPGVASVPYVGADSRTTDVWPMFERLAVVRVSDTGTGIADGEKDRVFFPFYTTKKQGSGVGLSMAKKIVSSHRGLIDVADATEGGALFTVRLPMILQRPEVRAR